MAIRSFLAFELPADIRSVLSTLFEQGRSIPLNVRWVRPGNIHLTIVFLGSVQEEDIGPIKQAAGRICRDYAPFPVQLKGVGLFGSRRSPKVLWVGVVGDIDRMSRFRDDLQASLIRFGITEERRPFRPHLTLGRFRKDGTGKGLDGFLASHRELNSAQYNLNELVLFKSDLKPSGAVYTRLGSWRFEASCHEP